MGDFLASPFGSYLRVFLAAVLSAWFLDLTNVAEIDFSNWETYLVTGLVSVLPVVIAALNGSDPRFGNVDKVDDVTPPTNP